MLSYPCLMGSQSVVYPVWLTGHWGAQSSSLWAITITYPLFFLQGSLLTDFHSRFGHLPVEISSLLFILPSLHQQLVPAFPVKKINKIPDTNSMLNSYSRKSYSCQQYDVSISISAPGAFWEGFLFWQKLYFICTPPSSSSSIASLV